MTKNTTYKTLQLIADILSYNDNKEALVKQIQQTPIDWDKVVIIGSKQLMLPALYCRLKVKGLLELLPLELNVYLAEITNINRGRNKILLQEAHEISTIFNKESIDHVFIKGMSLIAGNIYIDPAERMIGDMDVLVAENQIHTAFDLLTKHGYTDTITSINERKNHRHLPRQISPQKFGAIELHSEILRHKHRTLINNAEVLQNKRIINGISIPAIEDAIKISILALQINDKAHLYGYLNFKTIYDCLVLQLPSKAKLLKTLCDEKYSQSFLQISSIFFKELTPSKYSIHSNLRQRYFALSFHESLLGKLTYLLGNISIYFHFRLHLIFTSQSYRRHIIKHKIGLKIK